MRHYEKFWQQQLDTLEQLLEAEDAGESRTTTAKPAPDPSGGKGKQGRTP